MHEWASGLAAELIAENGRTMQLVMVARSGAAWDPVQSETTVDVVGMSTMLNYDEVDGDLIRRDDKIILLDSSTPPLVTHRLRDGDRDYSIVNVREIKPGETTILYKVQARL